MHFDESADGDSTGRLLRLLCVLWLVGMAMRITVLAVAPVIPLIRDDLRMSETEVGLLFGLPVATWALAAVPGSLLIARFGTSLTMIGGLLITGLAAAARGAAPNVWLLYLASLVMGFGIAIMQPAVPTLVRNWLPSRIGLGAAMTTNGMLGGGTLATVLTIPLILPLIGHSWRLELVLWALPVLLTAVLFVALGPRGGPSTGAAGEHGHRWWPNWRSPLIWLLGLTFGSNNAIFYATNAFLPDYLESVGRADLIGVALGSMNGSQLTASTLLLLTADALQRRAWPFLVFGPATVAAIVGIAWASDIWIVVAAALLGFCLSITFVVTFALPPLLATRNDVHHMSAGMFTISYACAVIVPVLCGALWDLTGRPWTVFVPTGICAIALTVLGLRLTAQRLS